MSDLLASMSDVRVTGEEKIDGRETFRLEGTLWGAQPIKLWIDKTQYVIVKSSRKVLCWRSRNRINSSIQAETQY